MLELMTGGELFEKIAMDGPLSEGAGRRVFQQLLDGLAYCHAQGVYHRHASLAVNFLSIYICMTNDLLCIHIRSIRRRIHVVS